jgi:hypothetical protein
MALQYQQMPRNFYIDPLWRVAAGWLYFFKQVLSIKPNFVRDMLKLRSLKDIYRGRECIIIGGGPGSATLKNYQYEALRDRGVVVLVLNNFWLSPLAKFIIPDFIVTSDPAYSNVEGDDYLELAKYVNTNPSIKIITPTNGQWKFPNTIRINGLSATGLWSGMNPMLPSTTVQGVFFDALKFSNYLGFSRIYVTGVEHSYYLNFKHLGAGRLVLGHERLHSYDESEPIQINSFLTRDMSDVLYAQAILLRDLKKMSKKIDILNVSLNDFTNDSFPMACLLPR